MRAQHQALQARRPIAFVSDTACDLPDDLVVQYDIGLVPRSSSWTTERTATGSS